MEFFLDCVFFIFALVAIVRGTILVFRSNMHDLAKGALTLFAAYLIFAFFPRSGASHGIVLTVLGTIGIVIVGAWAVRQWHDWRAGAAIAVIALLLISIKAYPHFVAGPSSIMPSFPAAPSAPVYRTSPSISSPRSSRRAPTAASPGECDPELSYTARMEQGCPP